MSLVNLNAKGATLLELIIAVVFVSTAVMVISVSFPRLSTTLTKGRHRMMANNFAASLMEDLQQQSYPYLAVNPAGDFTSDPSCNCKNVNMATFTPVDSELVDGGVTFTRKKCVHLIDTSTLIPTSYCPDNPLTSATDKGTKNIRIQVRWTIQGTTYKTELEGLVTR